MAIAIVAALAAVASCAFFTWKQASVYTASQQSGTLNSSNVFESGTSTPKSEWHQGEVPMLFQTDPAWGSNPYAGSDIATAGCGPTCLSMVYIALTGKTNMGPVEMAAFSEKNGYVQDGMTAWALMTDGASELGLVAEELPASVSALIGALEEGRLVIASMLPGDFTTVGHFIVIAGVDSSGKLVVRDPNSAERSMQTWDAQTVLAQCANLWAYSRG
ncbi:C39 family peptidase [uncultured Slackia sp.]|uniref:C39 family peptidase n=1 Tax=uncultured Slackia sp. TaxID=665903 RepID=UPI0025D295BB|nr:C39 family peptidase [uncultured Slackia sp.]